MTTNQINVSQICRTQICLEIPNIWYEYKTEIRWAGIRWRKEGFYYCTVGTPKLTPLHKILENPKLYVKDQTIYLKPHIKFDMSDETTSVKYFDTHEELYDFIDKPPYKNIQWINV